jgi:predicted transcriptional regulator
MDGAGRKRSYMMMIVEMVRKEPGITIDRIRAEMAWRQGLSPRRVSEYVETLVQVGQIREDGQGFSVAEKR